MLSPSVLERCLRPRGQGIYLVSTGASEQATLSRRLYGIAGEARANGPDSPNGPGAPNTVAAPAKLDELDEDVAARFRADLARLGQTRGIVLGIPSDTGAGFRRGANLGPIHVRLAADAHVGGWDAFLAKHDLLDLGDVFTVPQLLDDAMLSKEQIERVQNALYPEIQTDERRTLPVSPLTIGERVIAAAIAKNPATRVFVIGGDHSCAWSAVSALARAASEPWAIVQIDAHTDLLAERLGVRICFGTWSYHANELLGRSGRLVQFGIRATRRTKQHWEETLGVKQYWADECLADPAGAIDAAVAHLRATGIKRLYFSNDIDGTSSEFASATGTPEPNGLTPEFVFALIERLGREFEIVGGDIMEVAPPLGESDAERASTLSLAARYLVKTIESYARP